MYLTSGIGRRLGGWRARVVVYRGAPAKLISRSATKGGNWFGIRGWRRSRGRRIAAHAAPPVVFQRQYQKGRLTRARESPGGADIRGFCEHLQVVTEEHLNIGHGGASSSESSTQGIGRRLLFLGALCVHKCEPFTLMRAAPRIRLPIAYLVLAPTVWPTNSNRRGIGRGRPLFNLQRDELAPPDRSRGAISLERTHSGGGDEIRAPTLICCRSAVLVEDPFDTRRSNEQLESENPNLNIMFSLPPHCASNHRDDLAKAASGAQ